MCLAIPGKVIEIGDAIGTMRSGRVDFGGIVKNVNLAFLPDVAIGDYVVVHVGLALSKIDEAEAQEVFRYLEQMGDLAELGETSS